MTIQMRNWQLLLLAALFIALFTYLGCWQLSRANGKKLLLNSYTTRIQHAPILAAGLAELNDWRFYRAELSGVFDNDHTLLLDNKIVDGTVGYEVYTPFNAEGMDTSVLVDRGFIPMGENRQTLPVIPPVNGRTTIIGMINVPPTYVALGQISESKTITWPLRVEYVNLPQIAKLLNYALYPYVIQIDPKNAAAFKMTWQIVTIPPERHLGYAVQWFALALTLLILSVALSYRHHKKK